MAAEAAASDVLSVEVALKGQLFIGWLSLKASLVIDEACL